MSKTLYRDATEYGNSEPIILTNELIFDGAYTAAVIDVVKGARSEIRLCAYAWRWYGNEPELGIQKLNTEIFKARDRGVRVRCLVDTEKMVQRFKSLGFDVRAVENTKMLHTKAVAADLNALVLGSHNLTKRANNDNYEISIITREFEAVQQFATYFDKLWGARG